MLSGILEKIVAEGATAAEELRDSRGAATVLRELLPDCGLVPHEELKRMSANAKLVVRTGEAAPFSNVILRCGVAS